MIALQSAVRVYHADMSARGAGISTRLLRKANCVPRLVKVCCWERLRYETHRLHADSNVPRAQGRRDCDLSRAQHGNADLSVA